MKNFFKKLSFVMAAAMVISSLYAPAAKAAAKDSITLKGKAISKKSIFVGGEKVNFDYKIGKFNNKGANGKWSTSDTSIITVNKHGVVTAVGTGDATLMLKVKKNKKKGIKKELTFKVKLTAFARASKLEIPASDKAISLKVGETKDIIPTLTNKVDGVDTTYNVFAKSSDENVATAKVDGKKVTVEAKMASATPATITVFAAQKSNEDDAFNNKYKVEDSFTVKVIANLEAKQSGANTIKVMGNDLSTDSAMYVVKTERGATVTLKKDVKVNEAKTEAVLTADAARILKGNYVLTYNKETEVKFDVEDVVVKEIKFKDTEKAILQTADKTTAKVAYQVFDQFGNDITNNIGTTDFNAVSSAETTTVSKKGEITFDKGTNDFVPNFDKISTTLVYKHNGVNATALFTVSDVSKVWAVEYKGLYSVDKKAIVESLSESDDATKFLILFDVKDQYGNPVTLDATTKASLNVVLLGATKLNKVADSATPHSQKVGNDEYLAYQLTPASGHNFGEVDVMAIGLNNGVKANGKFNVTHAVKVKTFSIREGVKPIYAGQASEVEFEALDMNDKPVTDFAVLDAFKSKITASPAADFEFKKDVKTGKISLFVKPTAVPSGITAGARASYSVVVTGTTDAYKFFNTTLTVNNKKTPVAFLGIKSDAVTGALSGKELKIGFDALRFQDQFGAEMSAKEIGELGYTNFKIDVTVTKGAKESFDDASANPVPDLTAGAGTESDIVLNKATIEDATKSVLNVKAAAAANKGDADVKITFKDNATTVGDPISVKIYNVEVADLEKFAVEDVTLKQANAKGEVTKVFAPSVYGFYKEKKIKLEAANFEVVTKGDAKDKVIIPDVTNIKEGETTAKASFSVIVDNGKETTLTKEYTYSNEAPKVAKVEFDGSKLAAGNSHGWAELTANAFVVKDQYDNDITSQNFAKPYITYTFEKEKLTAGNAKVTRNGLTDATVDFSAAGEVTGKIKLTFPGSTFVYEGEITLKKTS